MTPEKKVQNQVIDFLKTLDYEHGGHLAWFRRTTDSTSKEGASDLFVVVNGFHLELELKAPGGVRSAAQFRWERICNVIGAPYLVADNLNSVKEFIYKYY